MSDFKTPAAKIAAYLTTTQPIAPPAANAKAMGMANFLPDFRSLLPI